LYTSTNLLFPTLGEPKLYIVTEIAPNLYTINDNTFDGYRLGKKQYIYEKTFT